MALAAALGLISSATDAASYNPIQTLGQGGAFPVNGLAGDAFGQVVAFNKEYLFVSSPGSQPNNKSIAGAVFVHRWDGAQYQQTQVITTGGTGDHLGMLQILSDGDWLALGVIGTPVGPQANDAISDQDFRGAVLIYRRDSVGQWQLAQTLDNNTPGLEDLSTIQGGGIPVVLTEQGGNFGLRMALDAEQGRLFVSALYQAQNSVINAGKVYAFRLDRASGIWTLAQTFTSPDGAAPNDGFGAAVAVKGRHAMIGNGPVFQGPHPDANSAVYVYRLTDGSWQYVQRLTGSQSDLTPFFFPQINPAPASDQIGDSFGNAIALDNDHAVITAPLESREVPGAVFTGAAYFFRLKRNNGDESWVLTHRIESDDPNSFAFGAFSVGIDSQTAVIGDIGWSATAMFQGAAHVYRRTGNTWTKASRCRIQQARHRLDLERALRSGRMDASLSGHRHSWASLSRWFSDRLPQSAHPWPPARSLFTTRWTNLYCRANVWRAILSDRSPAIASSLSQSNRHCVHRHLTHASLDILRAEMIW